MAGVTGPAAQPGATVAILSEDLRNGGIPGVVKGVKDAAATIGWRSKVYDALAPNSPLREVVIAMALRHSGATTKAPVAGTVAAYTCRRLTPVCSSIRRTAARRHFRLLPLPRLLITQLVELKPLLPPLLSRAKVISAAALRVRGKTGDRRSNA
ncbi:MAG: hypothetical protein V4757_12680 [Pseudomonadota bacterium]